MSVQNTTLPLVSVVIPAYNRGRFIGEALDSVVNQDYPALEVLVVDDGSTDDTCEIVSRYGEKVTLIKQKNAGAAVARNAGMARARGRYIALLDADDFWLPQKLRRQVEYLEKTPDVDMCCSNWHLLFPDAAGAYHFEPTPVPDVVRVDPKCTGWIYCELLLDCVVWTSTVVMRRELVERVGGFNPALRRGQDYDYWLRASRLSRIDKLEAPMAVYRMEDVSTVYKFPNNNWELEVINNAIQTWGTSAPDGRALAPSAVRERLWTLNYSFGHRQFRAGRFGPAHAAFSAALRAKPMSLRTLAYVVASRMRQLSQGSVSPSGT